MNRSGMPWMILVLALLGWQVSGVSKGGGNAATPPKNAEAPPPAVPISVAASARDWPELREQVETFFGQPAASGRPADLARLAASCGYRAPDSYLALVPDPLDSFLPARFDQVLAGIQEGFAEGGFLLDRIVLPWAADEGKKPDPKVYRTRPGLLLFRRPGKPGEGRLAIVFLVGETAKQGVHKQAFELAYGTARGFAAAARAPRIRILGPTFSGTRESLRFAFDAWRAKHPSDPPVETWLISGSATSPALDECSFDCGRPGVPGVHFFRTVMDDAKLLDQATGYLVHQLGWNRSRIALLTEADTGYGKGAAPGGDALVLRFSSGLSGLRKASEDAARGRDTARDSRPSLGPSALAISLADDSRPVDVVPEFSRLTTSTKDMALSNLLAVLCTEGKSYLGIVATDSRDRIFLAERVREICPDTQLFLLDGDLLLAHPQTRDALDGALVLSSSGLFTRGLPWLEPLDSEHRGAVRQFQSELHEGVVHAVESLRLDAENPAAKTPAFLVRPQAWISAIGNGSIWPLAVLPLPPQRTVAEPGALPSSKANAIAFSCLFALIALSFVLVRVARPLRQNIPGLPLELHRRGPFLLALVTLQISWGVLLVVGGLPLWAFGKGWEKQEAMTHQALALGVALALLGLLAFLLRDRLPRRFPNRSELGASMRWIAIVSTTVAVAGLLAEPLLHAWMAGGVELFHFRARKFSGGMSPIVSLAWIGGGYFLWSILEIKRRNLVAFQGATFPIPEMDREDPILPGCRRIARRLERRMTESSPTWPFWAVLALPAILSAIYLYKFVQPVAEARDYGRAFVALALGLFVLAMISFQRFLRLWAELTGLLERIETLGLSDTFRKLSGAVDWRPMKSFAWTLPPFKMTELSIERLGAVAGTPDVASLRALLAGAFEGHRVGDPKTEAAGRQALQAQFAAALKGATGWLAPGALQDFAAVRLISYVRTVFAHLRGSLIGALLPGFMLLLAISTYEIQPKRLLFLSVWCALAAFVLATLWTFVHMDRNATLSAIGGSTAGSVDLDRNFLQSMFTYGILPLLGLVATRFPQLEGLLQGYLNPLMRLVGAGGS